MSRTRMLVGSVALAVGVWLLPVASAGAANSPTFRDCSLVGGLDPDFVRLSGAAEGPGGTLNVERGQQQLGIEASESSDPLDNLGHVTLKVKVTTPEVPAREISGAGTGKVNLAVPLSSSKQVGRTYTISWAATFDNGEHVCPSSNTPENTTPKPFVVTVTK
jgi:hypothetical protein